MTGPLHTPVDLCTVDIAVLTPLVVRVAGRAAVPQLPWDRVGIIGSPDAAGACVAAADLARLLLASGVTLLPVRMVLGSGSISVGWAVPDPDLALLLCLGRAYQQDSILLVDQQDVAVISCIGGPAVSSPRTARWPTAHRAHGLTGALPDGPQAHSPRQNTVQGARCPEQAATIL